MKDAVGRIQRIVVLGGSSEIARATVAAFRADGPLDVVVAGRGEEIAFDARDVDGHPAVVARIFDSGEDVDVVIVAFGVLGDQAEAETDAGAAVEIASVNYVGAVSVLTLVSERLRAQGHGVLVVLSSVAGEVPRRSNYVYGSSKAGIDAFARGLSLRLAGTGVRVLVVRPGFVRTKMTAGLRAAPFAVGPETVAAAIVDGIRSGAHVVRVPRILDLVMPVVRLLPARVLQRL